MKAKLIHRSFEWLEGDYEPPEELADQPHLTVWGVNHNTNRNLITMKLESGTGIWSESGKLILYIQSGADLQWNEDATVLLSLEVRYGACQQQKGIKHVLRRLDVNTYNVIDKLDICVNSGSVRYLILNNSGNGCIATWLDQNVWGYVFIDLETMRQLPWEFYWRSSTLAPPCFSPDDSVVISCNYFRSGWWTDEIDDFWDFPCLGGLRKVGTICVHDITADTVTNHEVLINLPEGWLPVDPDNEDWDTIWGPEFISENEFRIWLPDGSPEILQLPLPAHIEIQRDLNTVRQDV